MSEVICITNASWVVFTYITNKRGKVKQKKKFFYLLTFIFIFPVFRKMYNEHPTFLGDSAFFNIVHGKISSFQSLNKEK